jgi:hypothetical protein
MSWGGTIDEGADKDLAIAFAAKTQPAIANSQQARAARLHALHAATRLHAELSHSADPLGIAVNVVHLGPFADLQQFER